MQMTGMTVWASLGAQRLEKVWLPPMVETVHLFGDNDDAGRESVERAAHSHVSEGRAVGRVFRLNDTAITTIY